MATKKQPKCKYPKRVWEVIHFLENFKEAKKRHGLKNLKWDYTNEGFHEAKDGHAPEEKNYCGTRACALGAAALAGIGGLEAGWAKDGYTWLITFGKQGRSPDLGACHAADTLGLTLDQVDMAFYGEHPLTTYLDKTTPKDVAKVLREFVEERTLE